MAYRFIPGVARAVTAFFTGDVNASKTITDAAPATDRLIRSEVTITPATAAAIAAGGSLAGVRGAVTVSAGKSLTEGFIYGVQGKSVLNGTLAEGSAARVTGVLGQTDLAAGTVTAGQVSGVWADLQGSPTLTVPDQVFSLRVTNSMDKNCYALAMFYGKATFWAQISEPSPSMCSATGTPGAVTGTTGWIKVQVAGQTRYIPLASSVS